MSLPQSIQDDAFNLEAKAMVILYKIALTTGPIFCLSPRGTWTWQGDTYDEVPCNMTQITRQGDGKLSRPKFTVVNPEGLFTAYINSLDVENASITRHRILKSDLEADLNVALSETYRISRILSVTRGVVSFECRGTLDGVNFKLPARTFNPPEFPHVRTT